MNVGFIPYGNVEVSSARIRCFWIAKYWPEASVVALQDSLTKIDVVVFQKGFQADVAARAQQLRAQGKKVVWDLCDPDWWFFPQEYAVMAQHVHAVVCPTRALADDFGVAFPDHSPWVIADRHDPEFHPTVKTHAPTQSPVLVWFGWAENRVALRGTYGVLERLWATDDGFR